MSQREKDTDAGAVLLSCSQRAPLAEAFAEGCARTRRELATRLRWIADLQYGISGDTVARLIAELEAE